MIPAPDTIIVKQDNQWSCPLGLSEHLIIINKDLGSKKEIKLRALFHGKEFTENVTRTTAGNIWDRDSIFFLTKINQYNYFYFHKATTGKQLLVNLDTGAIEDPELYASLLLTEQKEHIRAILSAASRSLQEGKGIISNNLTACIPLAAQLNMMDVRGNLLIIKEKVKHLSHLASQALNELNYPAKINDTVLSE
ncbi:MAG: hypothetical protein ACOY3Z_00275 [Thermodesulfobacteriota bacterium]